jgi:hypothetical protein
MAIHQCLFFMEQRVGYWENVIADGDVSIEALLENMRAEEEWHSAEAWATICWSAGYEVGQALSSNRKRLHTYAIVASGQGRAHCFLVRLGGADWLEEQSYRVNQLWSNETLASTEGTI